MATATANITNSVSITITVTGVTNTSVALSSAIDNSTAKYLSSNVQVKVKTNASGTGATGRVNVYLVRSSDGGTTYDDSTRVLIGTIPAVANATTYVATFSTEPFGPLGTTWKVAVENQSGATLDASVGAVTLTGNKIDVA